MLLVEVETITNSVLDMRMNDRSIDMEEEVELGEDDFVDEGVAVPILPLKAIYLKLMNLEVTML